MKLEVCSVSKIYGKNEVLDKVCLQMEPGIYGLIGPNGAGKSTLMRLITGEENVSGGRILWNGMEIKKLDQEYKQYLGYLPQEFGFYKEFTGREMLTYIGILKSAGSLQEIKVHVEELLSLMELEEKADVRTGKYSGGMKQRLGIAQAFLGNPYMIILDEPTAGLDPMQRIHLKKMLKEYGKKRIVLISTHIMSDVQEIADYLIFLKKGKVILNQSTENALRENENLETLYMEYFSDSEGK